MPMLDIKQNIHMIWPKYGTRMRRVSAYVIKLLALLTDIPMRGNEEDSSSSIFSNHIPLQYILFQKERIESVALDFHLVVVIFLDDDRMVQQQLLLPRSKAAAAYTFQSAAPNYTFERTESLQQHHRGVQCSHVRVQYYIVAHQFSFSSGFDVRQPPPCATLNSNNNNNIKLPFCLCPKQIYECVYQVYVCNGIKAM